MAGISPQGKLIPLFRKTSGLNLAYPAGQLESLQDGTVELAACANIDVSRTGKITRRNGWQLLDEFPQAHSLWADGPNCFFVSQDTLYRVNKNFTVSPVRIAVALSQAMYYCTIGDRVYYSNTVNSGFLLGNEDYPWEVTIYRGPTTDRIFHAPKRGKFLMLFHGRMYMALDNLLWFTEYMDYHKMDYANNYVTLPSRITGLAASEDCLWVATEDSIHPFTGKAATEFDAGQVIDYGVAENTLAKVPQGVLSKPGTWWFGMTSRGIVKLGPGGQYVNATWPRIALPASSGCAMVTGDKYVCTFNNQ